MISVTRALLPGLVVAALMFLVSCDGGGTSPDAAKSNGSTTEAPFTLQLLHASDMDSSTGALSNVENFSAILEGFRREYPDNTIVLSSGDNYVPGPRYFAAGDASTGPVLGVPGDGRGDIAFMNAMGFQASALGNHELDRGTETFAAVISPETTDKGDVSRRGVSVLGQQPGVLK